MVVCLAASLLVGCSTPSDVHIRSVYVRKVDVSASPKMERYAEHVRETAEKMYPKVCALLDDGDSVFPTRFDVVFKERLARGRMGETRLTEIRLNAGYIDRLREEPGLLDDLLVHEMAHVAQHYLRPIIGHWLVWNPRAVFCWHEGIADYVCFKLGPINAGHCAECSPLYPHFRNGYGCAGAFLMFLEQNFDPKIVPRLNTALLKGTYQDEFFLQATGKALPELWKEFQKTPAFTPNAARMLELQEQLGYRNGQPPRDINKRLQRYQEQHLDSRTRELMRCALLPGRTKDDPQARLAVMFYFTQPGGSAERFMVDLLEKHSLPGFSEGELGQLDAFFNQRILNPNFPVTRTFAATKRGDASTYHYTVARPSVEAGWKLERAWRTTPDKTVAEEFPLK